MSDAPGIQSALAAHGANALDGARHAAARGEAELAAHKFEALLATQLVKEMRKSVADGFFGSGAGADVFEGWFDEHLGQSLADSGALDLAATIRVGLTQASATTNAQEQEP